jgi:uncharacterized membrane protein YbhN (UPF0104 family)
LRDKILALLKVAVSASLIAYIATRPAIQAADWRSILASLRIGPWLLALAVYFVAIGLNVLKWQLLLRTLDVPVPYWRVFRHILVGLFFANLPLSMIGGDIARGWDLARGTSGQTAAVAVSVLVDRLIGLAAFLFAAVLGLACAITTLGRPDLAWLLTTMALILLGFCVAFAILMSQRLRRLAERLFRFRPLSRLLPLYLKASNSVQVYRTHIPALIGAFGLGLATVATTGVVKSAYAITVASDDGTDPPGVPAACNGGALRSGYYGTAVPLASGGTRQFGTNTTGRIFFTVLPTEIAISDRATATGTPLQ